MIRRTWRQLSHLKQRLYKSLTPKRDETLDIVDLRLTIDPEDVGGRAYRNRPAVEERNSLLYPAIASHLRPSLIVDIGANYGFTALVLARWFPSARLLLVEPDPKLQPYLRRNLSQNRVRNYELHQALCGDRSELSASFGINPRSSQDNRVRGLEGWSTVTVRSTTLSDLLAQHGEAETLIKIDTQGAETQVFRGAESYLLGSDRWLIKSEFAPDWLQSQGNSPVELLDELVARYSVIEAPARARFGRTDLQSLFAQPLRPAEVQAFVQHVQSLDRQGRGWVDLLVAPRGFRWNAESARRSGA